MNFVSPEISVCIDVPIQLGECPVWDEDSALLWFVDITAPALLSFDPETRTLEKYSMPSPIGSMGLATQNRLVVALKTGVHLFNRTSGTLEFLVNPEPDRPGNRLNDGKVGPDGCFWVGSMDEKSSPQNTNISGALYRVTPSGESTRVLDGLFVSNGLAWSPDGKTMYHADGLSPSIKAFDFDPSSGAVSNERILITFDYLEVGWPDGATTDANGNYWSAGIFKGRINQVSPQGELLRSIQMPVVGTTMPCFGGKSGNTLFVTSLAADANDGHQVGTLLSVEMDAQGAPVFRFGQRDA